MFSTIHSSKFDSERRTIVSAAFYCSPGARAECLQFVYVVIGGRLRGTIQRSSSLALSSSTLVVYESEAAEVQCRLKQRRSSEVLQLREEPLNLLYYYLGIRRAGTKLVVAT